MRFHEIVPIFNLLVGRRLDGAVFGSPRSAPGEASVPRTFLLHGEELVQIRQRWKEREEPICAVVEGFLHHADQVLPLPARSVREKEGGLWGESTGDYVSLARYWWPNPESSDGLPFVVRDGEINPDVYSAQFDLSRLEEFSYHAFVLGFAYAISGDEEYAKRCAELMDHWCLAPETCQSPHFEFAQIRPGRKRKGGVGIVEAHRLIYVVEAAQMIAGSPHWPHERAAALKGWFRSLLTWLRTSKNGLDAGARSNNIGVWYDVQCATYALYVGERDLAATIVQDSGARRLGSQLNADGSFPAELLRTRPYDYFAFSLLAYMALARVGESVNVDLWARELPDGRNLEAAVQWLRNVVQPETLSFDLALKADRLGFSSEACGEASEPSHLVRALGAEVDSLRWKVRAAAADRGELVALLMEQERRAERLRGVVAALAAERSGSEPLTGGADSIDSLDRKHGESTERARMSQEARVSEEVRAICLELEQLHREKTQEQQARMNAAAAASQLERRLREEAAAAREAERQREEAVAREADAQRRTESLKHQLHKADRKIAALEDAVARMLRARAEGEGRLRDRYEYLLQDQAGQASKKLAAEKGKRKEVARGREEALAQLSRLQNEQEEAQRRFSKANAKERRKRRELAVREEQALDALADAMRSHHQLAVEAARMSAELARMCSPLLTRISRRLAGRRPGAGKGYLEVRVIEESGILAHATALLGPGAGDDALVQRWSEQSSVELPVFAPDWYVARYPQVLLKWNNPLAEYLAEGWRAGRRPHPLFWGRWYSERYLRQQPDVCPLVHFLENAAKEDLDPNPLFDSSWYRRQYLVGEPAQTVPLLHYIRCGPAEKLQTSPRVDLETVRERIPQARVAGADPLAVLLDLPRDVRAGFVRSTRKGSNK